MSPDVDMLRSRQWSSRDLTLELLAVFARTGVLILLVLLVLNFLPRDWNYQVVIETIALVLVGGAYIIFFVRQLRAVRKSKFPNIRAGEAVFTMGLLLLTIFASIYVAISRADPTAFTEVLTPFSSMYLSLTVLATVGFGDIAPNSVPARWVTMVQMVLNLVFIGVVVRVFVGAAKRSVKNKVGSQREAD